MSTSTIYFIGSIVFFMVFLVLFVHNQKSHNKFTANYSLIFLSMFFFFYSLSVPAIVFQGEPAVIAWSNIIALVSLFSLIFFSLRVLLLIANDFLKKNFKLLNIIVFLFAVATISIQILSLPLTGAGGPDTDFISNLNIYSKIIFLIIAVPYGIFWSYLFYNVARLLREIDLKRRMLQLSVVGIFYAVAFIILFLVKSESWQFIAISLFVMCNIIIAISFVTPYVSNLVKKPQIIAA